MKTIANMIVVATLCVSLAAQAETPAKYDERAMMKQQQLGSDPTNTARNVRDKNLNTVLPEDQSNKAVLIGRTAAIRKEIVAQTDLSIGAKNIKVITIDNGTVVLRGSVTSDAEKSKIEMIAKRVAGSDPVVSYLKF